MCIRDSIVAHRLSTIQKCDRIMFISDGGIAESGTHEELLQRKGRYYGSIPRRALWKMRDRYVVQKGKYHESNYKYQQRLELLSR